jgi:serine/threonine protein kinase
MPLSESLRAALGPVAELDRQSTPPTLTAVPNSKLGDLSYADFQFDTDTDTVGSGGNAVVYRATLADEKKEVALKRPFPNKTVDNIEQMLDEAQTWSRVDTHPYVATVHDWGLDAVPWVAIEYLDGGPLTDRIKEFSFRQRLWTAYAIVDAVAYASGSRGVTHHDLKPQNVLFQTMAGNTWDVPKVVDWGLSRELITHTGSVSQATPEYAAPEQFDALRPEMQVGVHTDVYQLGVLCYELVTGTHPSHLDGDVRPPSEVSSAVPNALDGVLLTALAHDRSERFDHPLLFRESVSEVVETVVSADQSMSSVGDTSDSAGVEETQQQNTVGSKTTTDTDTTQRETQYSSQSVEDRIEHLLRENSDRLKLASIAEQLNRSSDEVSDIVESMEGDGRVESLQIGRERLISVPDSSDKL